MSIPRELWLNGCPPLIRDPGRSDGGSAVLFDKGLELSSLRGPRSKLQIKDVFSMHYVPFCIEPLYFLLNFSYFVLFSKDGQRAGKQKHWW